MEDKILDIESKYYSGKISEKEYYDCLNRMIVERIEKIVKNIFNK
jgi:hypothetical protein